MAFEYVLWVSPEAYEALYRVMRERGETSLKSMIRELLVGATEKQQWRAIELSRERQNMKGSRVNFLEGKNT